jgi:hypothetical protein
VKQQRVDGLFRHGFDRSYKGTAIVPSWSVRKTFAG